MRRMKRERERYEPRQRTNDDDGKPCSEPAHLLAQHHPPPSLTRLALTSDDWAVVTALAGLGLDWTARSPCASPSHDHPLDSLDSMTALAPLPTPATSAQPAPTNDVNLSSLEEALRTTLADATDRTKDELRRLTSYRAPAATIECVPPPSLSFLTFLTPANERPGAGTPNPNSPPSSSSSTSTREANSA